MKAFLLSTARKCVLLCAVLAILFSFAACEIPEISVTYPSEKELVTEHTFSVGGSYTVRGGYLSGSTTPSVSVNLGEVFDMDGLAKKNYKCQITVYYTAKVLGDHLNLQCTLGGVTGVSSNYTYLDHNQQKDLSCSSYNIGSNQYNYNATLKITWDCKGVTFLDGLNECVVSNVRVHVKFS